MVTDEAKEYTSLEVKCGKDGFLESPEFWKRIGFYFNSGLAWAINSYYFNTVALF